MSTQPLTSFQRAARLFIQADKLGCDTPTEAMTADECIAEFVTPLRTQLAEAERQLEPMRQKVRAIDSDLDCAFCGSPEHLSRVCPTLQTEERRSLKFSIELMREISARLEKQDSEIIALRAKLVEAERKLREGSK